MVTPRALVREAVHPAARVHRRMLLNTVCRGSLVFRLPGVQDQDILVPPLGGSRRAGRVIAESRHHVPLPVAAALDDAETVRPKSKPFPRGGGHSARNLPSRPGPPRPGMRWPGAVQVRRRPRPGVGLTRFRRGCRAAACDLDRLAGSGSFHRSPVSARCARRPLQSCGYCSCDADAKFTDFLNCSATGGSMEAGPRPPRDPEVVAWDFCGGGNRGGEEPDRTWKPEIRPGVRVT